MLLQEPRVARPACTGRVARPGPDEWPDQTLYCVECVTRHRTSSARNGLMAPSQIL
jgi:hypothetical protein